MTKLPPKQRLPDVVEERIKLAQQDGTVDKKVAEERIKVLDSLDPPKL